MTTEDWIAAALADAPPLSSAQRDVIRNALSRTAADPAAQHVDPNRKRGRAA